MEEGGRPAAAEEDRAPLWGPEYKAVLLWRVSKEGCGQSRSGSVPRRRDREWCYYTGGGRLGLGQDGGESIGLFTRPNKALVSRGAPLFPIDFCFHFRLEVRGALRATCLPYPLLARARLMQSL